MKNTWKKFLVFFGALAIVLGILPITVAAVEGMTMGNSRNIESIIIEADQKSGNVVVTYPSGMFLDEEAAVVCYDDGWNKDAQDLVSNMEAIVYLNQLTLSSNGGEFSFVINKEVELEMPYYLVIGVESKVESVVMEFLFSQDETPEIAEVIRVAGGNRYETGIKIADTYKEVLGVDSFDAVVIATGKNFADALAGSYLAVEKNAPIILTNGKADNIAGLHEYIAANVKEGGTIYILGGEGSVPTAVEAIDGYEVVRLAGKSRYETNLAILEEAGVAGDSIIVATGKSFADSLSASAAKLPILLVKPGTALDDAVKAIVRDMKNIYIIGGTGAVSTEIEAELAAYGNVTRVSGATRYETSVAVAETFFGNVEKVVVASGKNFPDGLCGGPLAAAMNAPLILTADGKTDAAEYTAAAGIHAGYVLGGTGVLADETVVTVYGLESAEEIIVQKTK